MPRTLLSTPDDKRPETRIPRRDGQRKPAARTLIALESTAAGGTRPVGTTDEPFWYARHLTALQAQYRIVSPPELRDAARDLGRRLARAGSTG